VCRSSGLSSAIQGHETANPERIRVGGLSHFAVEALIMEFNDFLVLLKQYGPLIFVVGYFLWQNWLRELRMSKRITKLEDEQRNVLLPMVERCTDVISQNTSMMERLEKALDERLECPLRDRCKG
jgi:hypothetical protein